MGKEKKKGKKMEKGVLIKKFPWEGGRILQNATIMAEPSSVGGVRGTLGEFVTTECIMFSLVLSIGLFDWSQLEIPLETCKLGGFNYSWSTVVISLLYTLSLSAFLYKDLYILGDAKVQAVQLQSTQDYTVHRGTYIAHSKHPTM